MLGKWHDVRSLHEPPLLRLVWALGRRLQILTGVRWLSVHEVERIGGNQVDAFAIAPGTGRLRHRGSN